jgi:hypothetical protein
MGLTRGRVLAVFTSGAVCICGVAGAREGASPEIPPDAPPAEAPAEGGGAEPVGDGEPVPAGHAEVAEGPQPQRAAEGTASGVPAEAAGGGDQPFVFVPGVRADGGVRVVRFGARLGFAALVGAAKGGYGGDVVGGVFLAGERGVLGREAYSFETGVEFATARSSEQDADSRMYSFHVGLLGFTMPRQELYWLAGAGAIFTLTDQIDSDLETGEIVGALDVGMGMLVLDERLDVRATYAVLLGSSNATGMLQASVGWRF